MVPVLEYALVAWYIVMSLYNYVEIDYQMIICEVTWTIILIALCAS